MINILKKLINKNSIILMDLKKNWHLIINNSSKPINITNQWILEVIIDRADQLIYISKKEIIIKKINYYLMGKFIKNIIFYSPII